MIRASCCRWCGTPLDRPAGPGRPPVWCSTRCTHLHIEQLGVRDRWDGDIDIVETCDQPCMTVPTRLVGPVFAPGSVLDAARQIAESVHGHDVDVHLERVVAPDPGRRPAIAEVRL